MRKLLGWAVLILGTGLLGYYATNNHAQRMEQAISGAAAQAVTSSVHGVTTRVSGRDIIVEGIANDAAEHDQIVAALDAVDGRRVVDDRLTILERAAPFVLTAERAGDAASYSGNVPTEAVRATLAERIGESGANALDLAAGMPDDAWPGAALQGLDALDLLESGKMVLSDRSLTLTGQAYSPVERDEAKAALEGLADGYSVQTDITTRIPLAAPYLMQAVKDAGTTRHSGNVPDAQTRANFAATMGADADTLELAIGMPDSDWPGVVTQALGALDQLEGGELRVDDRMITLTGVARSPLEQAAAEAALADLPEGYPARTDITARIALAQP
ncbi:MAG TPA: hypothetical protein ENK83_06500, partial [Aliiroseovarius sp.]|nr:hypothetical protein [Aliiroseovarius sp.]